MRQSGRSQGQEERTVAARWARLRTIETISRSQGHLMNREGACRSRPGVQTESGGGQYPHLRRRGWQGARQGLAQVFPEAGSCAGWHIPAAGARTPPRGEGGRWGDVGQLSSLSQAGSQGGQGARGGPSAALSLTQLSAPQYESKMGSLKKPPTLQPSKEAW